MKGISLFSGVGGMDRGFENAGIETVLQAENEPWCLSVLERHWPNCERVSDVRQVNAGTLRGRGRHLARTEPISHLERVRSRGDEVNRTVDLVYGGFPCQDVSVAGQRAGFRGERSSLWFEFERILSELRPQWCLIENVPGLLSSNGGRDFSRVLMGLEHLGYGWAYRVLDARWFGVPQRRRRVFVVGCLGDAASAQAVLAVCESCGGHPPTGREAGEDVAPETDDGARVAGSLGAHRGNVRADQSWTGQLIAATLSSGGHPGSNMPGRHKEDDENLVVGRPLLGGGHGRGNPLDDNLVVAHSLPSENGQRNNGTEQNFIVASTVRASDGHHGHSSPRGDGSDNLIAFQSNAGTRLADELSEDYFGPVRKGSGGASAAPPAISGSQGVAPADPVGMRAFNVVSGRLDALHRGRARDL